MSCMHEVRDAPLNGSAELGYPTLGIFHAFASLR